MSNTVDVVIVTDGNATLGLGHVMRELGIARRLTALSKNVLFLTPAVLAHKLITAAGYPVQRLESLAAAVTFAQNQQLASAAWLIDVHERDFTLCRGVSKHVQGCLALLYSPSGADFEPYGDVVFAIGVNLDRFDVCETRVLGEKTVEWRAGRAYIPLRPEFDIVTPPTIREKANRILVCSGGSNPHSFLETVLQALHYTELPLEVTVVIGPAVEQKTSLAEVLQGIKHLYRCIVAPTDMPALIANHDLAVIAGGMMRYELCRLGVPFIAVPFTLPQYNANATMAALGAGINAAVLGTVSSEELARRIQTLLEDYPARVAMQKQMLRLFDARGSERIIARILRGKTPANKGGIEPLSLTRKG